MLEILKKLPDLLFPFYCHGCSKNLISRKFIMCNSCICTVKKVVSLKISITEKKGVTVFAGGAYQEPLSTILKKKFSRDTFASKLLGNIIIQNTPFEDTPADIITPIPLHWTRYAWRGYNQSKIIASILSKARNLPLQQLLIRKKKTLFQSKLSLQQRMKNVENTFCINPWYKNSIKNKHIILVDDLYTTGSTIKSACEVLFAQQPASITVFVGCRAI
jgi:ComF family protein